MDALFGYVDRVEVAVQEDRAGHPLDPSKLEKTAEGAVTHVEGPKMEWVDMFYASEESTNYTC